MGCHTWFYEKCEISFEDIRKNVINQFEADIILFNKLIFNRDQLNQELLHDSDDSMYNPLEELFPEWTCEYGRYNLAIKERQLRMVKKGLCKCALYNHYVHLDMRPHINIVGVGIFISSDKLPHDIFRKYDYPDDQLFSFDETLAYITNPKNKCHLYLSLEETIEQLQLFWTQYPDGLIQFG